MKNRKIFCSGKCASYYRLKIKVNNEYDVKQCYFCGSKITLDIHHIIPVSFCGSDNNENKVTLCYSCHKKLHRIYNKLQIDNSLFSCFNDIVTKCKPKE
jgi:5-methylcytosine-specific restriction endonuclease McrA